MNTKESVASKTAKVEKRYGKTLKGTASKAKTKVKVRPILKKNKIGIKYEVKF